MSAHGFILLFFSFFGIVRGMAQTPEEGAQYLATQLCNCVNDSYKDINPKVQDALIQLLRYQLDERPKEMERYINSLPQHTLHLLHRQIDVLQERGALSKRCLAHLEATMRNMDTSHQAYNELDGGAFNQLILEALKTKEKGNLATVLWELGLRSRLSNTSQQVNIGRVHYTKQ